MRETEKIWMNGEFVDWADAKIHVGAHGLHYGTGVFEGIRCYETPRGPAVFRLTDHLKRLEASGRLLHMDLGYSVEELRDVSLELIGVNGLPECYLRPIAFYGYGELGVSTVGNPVDVVIMSWPWGAYLGDEGMKNGIRCKISSWKRVGPNTIPHAAKATGIYLNSMLAVMEAIRAGLRRGDPPHRRRLRRGRLGRERLHRQERDDPDPAALHLDPSGDHPAHADRDRSGSRLHGRGTEPDPNRPLSRRRDVHGRNRCRGDSDSVRGRPRDRAAG